MSAGGEGLDILEVAAGTGRFATFVRDNLPRARMTVTELSPFYLDAAKENMAYYERARSGKEPLGPTSFTQCAAEALPFADGSQDAVYAIYLFHEMPREAQTAALKDFARVLKPGGILVLTDSYQWGDRPANDARLAAFSGFNEPHYPAFLSFDFGAAVKAAGLVPDMKLLQSASKTISAVKPLVGAS